tara:strand:- start:612 stop:1142 length:531 start_codon:yes stop_codon:yes gene_type:complete
MRKIVLIFMMLTCFLLADTKIGYIDATAVLSQYDDVRQVQVELEKEQRRLQTVWDSKKTTLDSLMSAYETKSMLMSEQKQQEMTTMINAKRIELEEWQIKYFGPEGELYKMQGELMIPIYRSIDEVIDKYAKANGYDFILDAQGLLYALPNYDLTQIIIDELKKLNATNDDNNQLK